MAQSGIWASWSVSLIWDAGGAQLVDLRAFGYGFMSSIGFYVISPLTVGTANQPDG